MNARPIRRTSQVPRTTEVAVAAAAGLVALAAVVVAVIAEVAAESPNATICRVTRNSPRKKPRWIASRTMVRKASSFSTLLAQGQAPHILLLDVSGIINQVKHRYISRAIDQAVEDRSALVVIELDTPGGLLSSTRDIVQLLLDSPVPVAVYVSPPRR